MADTVIVNADSGEEHSRPLTAEEETQRQRDADAAAARQMEDDTRTTERARIRELRQKQSLTAAETVELVKLVAKHTVG